MPVGDQEFKDDAEYRLYEQFADSHFKLFMAAYSAAADATADINEQETELDEEAKKKIPHPETVPQGGEVKTADDLDEDAGLVGPAILTVEDTLRIAETMYREMSRQLTAAGMLAEHQRSAATRGTRKTKRAIKARGNDTSVGS